MFRLRYTHRAYPRYGFYLLAKITVRYDRGLLVLTAETFGGHLLKRLSAGVSALWVYLMLRRGAPRFQRSIRPTDRRPFERGITPSPSRAGRITPGLLSAPPYHPARLDYTVPEQRGHGRPKAPATDNAWRERVAGGPGFSRNRPIRLNKINAQPQPTQGRYGCLEQE